MAWFRNYYRHEACDVEWTDEWSCACNDRCPECDAEIEPYNLDDLDECLSGDSAADKEK